MLPLCFPEPNGQVERTYRTYAEKSYVITPFPLPVSELNRQLLGSEHTQNTFCLTKLWATSDSSSSMFNPHPKERSPSVTNLLASSSSEGCIIG